MHLVFGWSDWNSGHSGIKRLHCHLIYGLAGYILLFGFGFFCVGYFVLFPWSKLASHLLKDQHRRKGVPRYNTWIERQEITCALEEDLNVKTTVCTPISSFHFQLRIYSTFITNSVLYESSPSFWHQNGMMRQEYCIFWVCHSLQFETKQQSIISSDLERSVNCPPLPDTMDFNIEC